MVLAVSVTCTYFSFGFITWKKNENPS